MGLYRGAKAGATSIDKDSVAILMMVVVVMMICPYHHT